MYVCVCVCVWIDMNRLRVLGSLYINIYNFLLLLLKCFSIVIWYQVFLFNTNNLYTVLWSQVFLSNTKN